MEADEPRRPTTALLEAFHRKKPQLQRLLEARGGTEFEADDLLQDLFVKLVSFGTANSVEDPEAFCFRLALNLATDRHRTVSRRRRREECWRVESGTFSGAEPLWLEPAADEAVASRQQLAAVLATVESLPPRAREVFRLHKLEGLTYAQTAQKLAISVSAVEKHMMRALAAVTRAVER